MEQAEQHGQGSAVVDDDRILLTCTCGWAATPQPSGHEAGRAFDDHRSSVTAKR